MIIQSILQMLKCRNINGLIFLSFIICLLLTSYGCKKNEEVKLTGRWLKVVLDATELGYKDSTIWTFKDNKLICYQNFSDIGDKKKYLDTTEYTLKRKIKYWVIKFKTPLLSQVSMAPSYTIEKLNGTVLILDPIGAYQRIEFYKIK